MENWDTPPYQLEVAGWDTAPYLRLDLHGLPWLWLENLNFGIALVDLLFEPVAGIALAVSQQHRARFDLAHKVQEFFTIGMRCQVEVFDPATLGYLAGGGTEYEC